MTAELTLDPPVGPISHLLPISNSPMHQAPITDPRHTAAPQSGTSSPIAAGTISALVWGSAWAPSRLSDGSADQRSPDLVMLPPRTTRCGFMRLRTPRRSPCRRFGCAVEELLGQRIPLGGRLRHHLRRDAIRSPARQRQQPRSFVFGAPAKPEPTSFVTQARPRLRRDAPSARLCFDAAGLAADAGHAAGRTTCGRSRLPCRPATAPDAPAEHPSAADAGADGDVEDAVAPLAHAETPFAHAATLASLSQRGHAQLSLQPVT